MSRTAEAIVQVPRATKATLQSRLVATADTAKTMAPSAGATDANGMVKAMEEPSSGAADAVDVSASSSFGVLVGSSRIVDPTARRTLSSSAVARNQVGTDAGVLAATSSGMVAAAVFTMNSAAQSRPTCSQGVAAAYISRNAISVSSTPPDTIGAKTSNGTDTIRPNAWLFHRWANHSPPPATPALRRSAGMTGSQW